MENQLTIIKGIIHHGITLDMDSPDLLIRIRGHFDKMREYSTQLYHHRAFLVISLGQPVAKITIENGVLSFDFAVDVHVFPVIMATLKYLYNLRWN